MKPLSPCTTKQRLLLLPLLVGALFNPLAAQYIYNDLRNPTSQAD
jgi:hypothetical protein